MTNVLIDGMDATDPVFGFSPARQMQLAGRFTF